MQAASSLGLKVRGRTVTAEITAHWDRWSTGHPTPETISTLAEHRVPTLRTDSDGEVTIDVTRRGWSARAGD